MDSFAGSFFFFLLLLVVVVLFYRRVVVDVLLKVTIFFSLKCLHLFYFFAVAHFVKIRANIETLEQ